MATRRYALFCLCSAWALGAVAADDRERAQTLRAINWVENPRNHTRPGSKGELGPYQFRSSTWRQHTRQPFSAAVVRSHADAVAVRHYDWIRRGLVEAGIDPSPFNVALAWNSGLAAVLGGRVPSVSYRYAERVSNLVERQRLEPGGQTPPAPEARAAVAARFDLGPSPAVRYRSPSAPRFDLAPAPTSWEPIVRTDSSPALPRDGHAAQRDRTTALAQPSLALLR